MIKHVLRCHAHACLKSVLVVWYVPIPVYPGVMGVKSICYLVSTNMLILHLLLNRSKYIRQCLSRVKGLKVDDPVIAAVCTGALQLRVPADLLICPTTRVSSTLTKLRDNSTSCFIAIALSQYDLADLNAY